MSGDPVVEYTEASENMRHFGNIRFAQMTLFFAITAGILTGLFQANSLSNLAHTFLKVGGLLIAILFWIMDERAMDYWHHYRQRAKELEVDFGFKQYAIAPPTSYLSATQAIRILHGAVALFWIATLIWSNHF